MAQSGNAGTAYTIGGTSYVYLAVNGGTGGAAPATAGIYSTVAGTSTATIPKGNYLLDGTKNYITEAAAFIQKFSKADIPASADDIREYTAAKQNV